MVGKVNLRLLPVSNQVKNVGSVTAPVLRAVAGGVPAARAVKPGGQAKVALAHSKLALGVYIDALKARGVKPSTISGIKSAFIIHALEAIAK